MVQKLIVLLPAMEYLAVEPALSFKDNGATYQSSNVFSD